MNTNNQQPEEPFQPDEAVTSDTENTAAEVLADAEVKPEETQTETAAEESVPAWRKILSGVSTAFLCFGAMFALIFTFLVGCTVDVSASGTSVSMDVDIWYYFGEAYRASFEQSTAIESKIFKTIKGYYYLTDVFGTVISAGIIISVVTCAMLTAVGLIKKFVFNKNAKFTKYAFATILSYVAGVTAFMALHTLKLGNMNLGMALNGVTVAGVVLCAICLAGYVICNRAAKFKQLSGATVLRTSVAVFSSALAVAVLVLAAMPAVYYGMDTSSLGVSGMTVELGLASMFSMYLEPYTYFGYNGQSPMDKLAGFTGVAVSGILIGFIVVACAVWVIATNVKSIVNGRSLKGWIPATVLTVVSLVYMILCKMCEDRFMDAMNEQFTYSGTIVPVLLFVFAFVNLAAVVVGEVMKALMAQSAQTSAK